MPRPKVSSLENTEDLRLNFINRYLDLSGSTSLTLAEKKINLEALNRAAVLAGLAPRELIAEAEQEEIVEAVMRTPEPEETVSSPALPLEPRSGFDDI